MSEWIGWEGKATYPNLPLDTKVELRFRRGDGWPECAVDHCLWLHDPENPSSSDIVAYRVVQRGTATPRGDTISLVLCFLSDLCHPKQYGRTVPLEVRKRARELATELESVA